MDGVLSLSIPYFSIIHITVVSVRVSAALLFAPIWGYGGLPQYLRILLVFAVALGVSMVTPPNEQAYLNPAIVIPTEFLIGLLLSMGIRIAFAGLHFGGQMVGYHLGFSAVQTIDPQTSNRSTLMSGFYSMLGYVLILATDQHHGMLRALNSSYAAFPVGTPIQMNQWFDSLIQASTQIFVIGWKIALPVFIAAFMIELTVGFIARMQPQLNTMIVTAPLKLFLGMIVLGASLVFLPQVIGNMLEIMVLKK